MRDVSFTLALDEEGAFHFVCGADFVVLRKLVPPLAIASQVSVRRRRDASRYLPRTGIQLMPLAWTTLSRTTFYAAKEPETPDDLRQFSRQSAKMAVLSLSPQRVVVALALVLFTASWPTMYPRQGLELKKREPNRSSDTFPPPSRPTYVRA